MSETVSREFLERHHLLARQYDPAGILSAFLDEMKKGLAGSDSSLAMIPSFIPLPERPPRNQSVIAVDAGGTHIRTTLVRFDEASNPRFDYHTVHTMPGADEELSREQFFDRLADLLEPVIGKSDRLAFCFSYPAAIDRQRDGRLLYWTKEIQAPEVVGEKILANLEKILRHRGLPCPAHRLILNDTIAALLAGCAATSFSPGLLYVGFILGTGTNTAYVESNRNILKEPDLDPAGVMAINCETANFNRLDRGDIDQELDRATTHPGKYMLEKMVSGAYLGPLCHRVFRKAAAEGMFSTGSGQAVEGMPELETDALGGILAPPPGDVGVLGHIPVGDRETIRVLADAVVERAALLTAVHMAAPLIRSAQVSPAGPPHRVCLCADGSVYFMLPTFRERAERYLQEILSPHGIDYSIVHVDEATLIGTAVAGVAI
jgi:hexokinase